MNKMTTISTIPEKPRPDSSCSSVRTAVRFPLGSGGSPLPCCWACEKKAVVTGSCQACRQARRQDANVQIHQSGPATSPGIATSAKSSWDITQSPSVTGNPASLEPTRLVSWKGLWLVALDATSTIICDGWETPSFPYAAVLAAALVPEQRNAEAAGQLGPRVYDS